MTPRVLVTGAAGFIAGHLAGALRGAGVARIAGVDRQAVPAGRVDVAHLADLLNAADVARVVAEWRPDEVYHLVGDARGPEADVSRSNIETARTLLAAIRAHAPEAAVVLLGSAAEYGEVPANAQPVTESWEGHPQSAYGRAKQQVSRLAVAAADDGMRVVVARPFNVVGARVPATLVVGAVVERLRLAVAADGPRRIQVGDTTGVRDFVDAGDVAGGLVRLARRGAPGSAYNLCTGRGHTVADVVERLVRLAGGGVEVASVPGLSRPGDVRALVGSPARAAMLGWRAERSLDDSLADAWAAAPAAVRV
ncbi:MAG: NAD-dependent epimerase/dehydratase family protein [Gemmatimonadota bacterium]|nr:NAD-dependent epimerase/dehydratase family protein [Gemmatimonadota bacterium]